MNNNNMLYVGLDVHKESITVSYAINSEPVELMGKISTSPTDIHNLYQRIRSKSSQVSIVYKAGPCGYGLYRRLVKSGFDCMVCAPSLIPKKPGERGKTDTVMPSDLCVHCVQEIFLLSTYPAFEDEAFRDLARAWASARDDLRHARQRLKSFLLVHGVHYVGRADWGPAHRRWLSKYSFESPWRQLAFDEHRCTIEDRQAQCERLESARRRPLPNGGCIR